MKEVYLSILRQIVSPFERFTLVKLFRMPFMYVELVLVQKHKASSYENDVCFSLLAFPVKPIATPYLHVFILKETVQMA